MYGYGVPEVIIIIIIALFFLSVIKSGKSPARTLIPRLVPRKFIIDDTPGRESFLLEGRAPGLKAWLLTLIGLDDEISLKLTDKEVKIKTTSIKGSNYQIVALPSIASAHCSFRKNPFLFLLGAYLLLFSFFVIGPLPFIIDGGGSVPTIYFFYLFLSLFLGILFLIGYFFSRNLSVFIETEGGMVLGCAFKQGVIENVSLDMAQALKMIEITKQKVIASQAKKTRLSEMAPEDTEVAETSERIQKQKMGTERKERKKIGAWTGILSSVIFCGFVGKFIPLVDNYLVNPLIARFLVDFGLVPGYHAGERVILSDLGYVICYGISGAGTGSLVFVIYWIIGGLIGKNLSPYINLLEAIFIGMSFSLVPFVVDFLPGFLMGSNFGIFYAVMIFMILYMVQILLGFKRPFWKEANRQVG